MIFKTPTPIRRIVITTLFFAICIVAFASIRLAVSGANAAADNSKQQLSAGEDKKNSNVESSAVTLKAAKRGFPLLNLQDGKSLATRFSQEGAQSDFDRTQARALTMLNSDLNSDGAQELIAGYANSTGGYLAIHQGNPDSLSAKTPEVFEAMKEGRFPAPFLPEANVIQLPVAPDFIGAGDFNRDGYKDIVAAARGGNTLVLLAGNQRGGFKLQNIELPGRATALIAENIDPLDGQTDIAVSITDDNNAAWLLVFEDGQNVFANQPQIYPLPAAAISLAVGQLDDNNPPDIIAAAGGRAVIIHGTYPEKSDENQTAANARQVETLNDVFGVAAVRVGNFIWDRDKRAEIALLSTDGSVRILQRGKLNKTPYTEKEWEAHIQQVEEQDAAAIVARHANSDARSANPERTDAPQSALQQRQIWTEADSFSSVAAPVLTESASNAFFTSARMTSLGTEDLLVLDPVNNRLQVLLPNNEQMRQSGESSNLSASGERAVVSLETSDAPAAILPMRLNVTTRPGIVVLNQRSGEISYSMSAPTATINVTKTADTADGVCDGDCSLREAIIASNASFNNNGTSTPDTIMVPAGTYTLTLGPADRNSSPRLEASGDLDVKDDVTIIGAGQATTIIQAGTNNTNGIDRVFHAQQALVGVPDMSISGVTIRYGYCANFIPNDPISATTLRCTIGGGGIDYAVDDDGALTISNSSVSDNSLKFGTDSTNNKRYGNGGGIYMARGDANFTNVTIANNNTGVGTNTTTDTGGDGGGVLFAFNAATGSNTATLTNCTVTGNVSRFISGSSGGFGGGIEQAYDVFSVSGGTYSNNVADVDGGAFHLKTAGTITGGTGTITINTNTAKRDGGGVWSDPLDLNNVGTTVGITNAVVRGNTADSDGASPEGFGRGTGGGVYHDRGTLNLTNVTVGGTASGQPNTAYDGGGIGHRYLAPASTSNAATININNGSIVGNIANNDGGGVFSDATRTAGATATLNIGATTAVPITSNQAKNNGGGIANIGGLSGGSGAAANLNNMTLRSNQANSDSSGGGDGGAVYNDGAFTTPSTVTFTGTLTVGGSGFANSAVNGGGLRNNSGTITIPTGASVTYNTASGAGGGISNAGTLSALATATITNNTATGNGGGIFNTGTLGTISTPTLNSNSAVNGGGIYTSNGILTVTNGTINSNSVTGSAAGGGILFAGSGASTVTGATVNNNGGSGIYITANALDITNTTITGNTNDGISKTGTGTGSELINGNTIFNNGSLGIDLGDNGVTANDAGDTDTGPNNLQNYPVINYVLRGNSTGNVTLNSTANRNFRINFFANTTCDSSGFGEGEASLGTQNVTTNASGTVTFTTAALAFGTREQITATATDLTTGDTSEFSACRAVNTVPTITAQSGVTRQQGSSVSNSQIATVADPDQALNTLAVTIRAVGGAAPGTGTATVNGVTVSNIAVSASGVVTADIIAACGATNANFTLRVTDNVTEFSETTLAVAVTQNTAPTVGTYANTTVNTGSSITVTPSAAPTDNGSIASVTATASAGFTGTFSTNTTTGAVTITNAAPAGTYTITVTTTDNCGASTPKTFTLTVNALPTITAQSGVSRQQGSAATSSQIATVNDADQSANTLVVTIRAVGAAAPGAGTATVNGVTVSNIAVSASGVVTADVVASCSATNAAFTLRVTDTNGAFNEATLNVTVTNNTAPTVGTYPNTTVNTGGSTTVAPTAAPADNGTFTASVASSAGFTGMLGVNQTTGVVTVTNANPAGTYTITVTFTDSCGLSTPRTFTLTVNTPPTITAASGVTRQQANGTSNSQIATVSDADQTSNTLVVTIRAVGAAAPGAGTATVNGVTVSNIAVSAAGVVTADIVASAAATDASFTLRVTDNQGSFAEATLNVAVTAASYEADVFGRPSGDTVINTNDIDQIRNFSVGLNLPYQSNEFQRADCAPRSSSGDGFVDADDVQQARRYSAATDAKQTAAGPTSPPMNMLQVQTAKSFVETVIGLSNLNAPQATPALRIDNQFTSAGQLVTVPIRVDTAGNETGYTFGLSYDATILTNPQVTIGTAGGDVISNTTTAGQIGFSVTSFTGETIAAGTNLLLVNVQFTVANNTPAGMTAINFTDTPARRKTSGTDPNTPIQQPTYANGTVTIAGATAAAVTIGGRVSTSAGRGISGVRLTLTDANGRIRTATSTSFGYYRFENVEAGATYIISASGKHLTFRQSAQVLNINEANDQINFIAEAGNR